MDYVIVHGIASVVNVPSLTTPFVVYQCFDQPLITLDLQVFGFFGAFSTQHSPLWLSQEPMALQENQPRFFEEKT